MGKFPCALHPSASLKDSQLLISPAAAPIIFCGVSESLHTIKDNHTEHVAVIFADTWGRVGTSPLRCRHRFFTFGRIWPSEDIFHKEVIDLMGFLRLIRFLKRYSTVFPLVFRKQI
jgi:hypothetical protein